MPFPRLLFSAVATWLLCLGPAAAQNAPIQVVTEELPPYNMTENGQVTGMCTELVRAVLKEAGLDGQVQVMPWARAYDMALHVDNVLIYSMSRTPDREKLFQWVGPLLPVRWYLYTLASHPLNLTTLEDAQALQVATVNQDSGEQFLQSHGFEIGRNLQSSSRYALDYEKLKSGHVDLWISDELNAYYIVRQAGDEPGRVLMPALALPQLGQDTFSIAMSRGTAPQTVEQLRKALARLHQNGTYDAILKKWM
ncbi:transporter substrate-binding domain-containing protein [Pseudomonas sp. NPDC007930]|uniref:substrate-binding periplasmic protein n=1 Tax=Pseudomonas sp. NPDC007930 TaxID=3364417 RepID=UPI0036E88FB0